MGKKLTKFLNIISFGHLNRKAKKEAIKQAENKNTELTLNTVNLPDISVACNALGGIENVANISATISTITFQINDMNKLNVAQLQKLSAKGVIKSENNITLLVGDCAMSLKDELLKLKK